MIYLNIEFVFFYLAILNTELAQPEPFWSGGSYVFCCLLGSIIHGLYSPLGLSPLLLGDGESRRDRKSLILKSLDAPEETRWQCVC